MNNPNNQEESRAAEAKAPVNADMAKSHISTEPNSISHVNPGDRKGNASAVPAIIKGRAAIPERLKYAMQLCIDNKLDPTANQAIVAEIMREDYANNTPINNQRASQAARPQPSDKATAGQLKAIAIRLSANASKKAIMADYLKQKRKSRLEELTMAEASRLINLLNNKRDVNEENRSPAK